MTFSNGLRHRWKYQAAFSQRRFAQIGDVGNVDAIDGDFPLWADRGIRRYNMGLHWATAQPLQQVGC